MKKAAIKQKIEIFIASKFAICMMGSLILAAALFYMYFANVAVRTLSALERTKSGMQSLNVALSEMESKRLAAENSVSAKLAATLGFVEADHPTFIMKGAQTALSFKSN